MEQKINIQAGEGHTDLIIREGEAIPLKEPKILKLMGILSCVLAFLKQRVALINQKAAHILVNRDKNSMSITLKLDETDFYGGEVCGKIILAEDFVEFGINKGKKYSLRDLSDFIKMHRYCFSESSVAMKLVTDLRNFKGKVEKELEKMSDQRGNQKTLMAQVVDSNIPESFTLKMPIFKGCEPATFNVETNIIVRDAEMECTLESVEANDIVNKFKEEAINLELKMISEVAPDIVQIEV